MPKQKYEVEILGDIGPVITHPEVFTAPNPELSRSEDSGVSFRAVWIDRQERLVEDFIKHPFRDGIAAALTLGGLGVAVGAAATSKRR